MRKARILVQGIVQGVGFRPTVYRIAKALGINGYVRNLGNVVEIVVVGNEKDIKTFAHDIKIKKPPISKIDSLEIEWLENDQVELEGFQILESSANFSGSSVIPPDVATCDRCLEEVMKTGDRRHQYPFTACTDCGPRFTVIRSIPYDRQRTSMEEFPLCPDCLEEYQDPEDRRYHAEATCCPVCGPEVFLYHESRVESDNPLKYAAQLLDEGHILAIKGIGGTHLVASTLEDEAVGKLRKRLGRLNQPFACMSPDVDTIKSFAEVADYEEEALLSRNRPIVILKKNQDYYLSPTVAPGLHNLGVMLPYSALHHLLFTYTDTPAYIMTSANMPGEPMLTHNQDIISKLEGVADYFLLHNREIINRCDDSVVRFRGGDMAFIRRSRGYVPEPYDFSSINKDMNVLALGPEIDVTFSLLKEGKCYVSQHIGNTTKYDTFLYLQEAIEYLLRITKTQNIDAVACDLHPQFFTTKLAHDLGERFNCPVLPVQHHHAHAAALSLDWGVDEFICIAADGVGYGADGGAWGGEILHYQGVEYERLASLMPQKMPGGDLTTRYPARMMMAMLQPHYSSDQLQDLIKTHYLDYFPHGEKEVEVVANQLEKNFNLTESTSTGRVLDALAACLQICGERTYEGECAMKLESTAYQGEDSFEIPIKVSQYNGRDVLDTSHLLLSVLERKLEGEPVAKLACSAQKAVSKGLAELAIRAARKKGLDIIGGSGGVFYNEAISMNIKEVVEDEGYTFIQHKNSCAGDGSVSLGQAALAALKYGKGLE
ncbi:MAG: hydrogenase maturation protein HypF [Methanobacterium sp.]|uniref:carbamoyltransferase HypF n=1 Tax=Methanobacterium sp. TaxID=2164 RepID=UPI0003C9B2C6|nr:carbamoyltransferase HypF [Methanobacterium sp.]MDI3549992.1 hydrogenase maturation protein HypF [Methanobacterium sp.]CDG65973.1 putative carbamoyltransferase HypF [Methanobacterium sp. MB1]